MTNRHEIISNQRQLVDLLKKLKAEMQHDLDIEVLEKIDKVILLFETSIDSETDEKEVKVEVLRLLGKIFINLPQYLDLLSRFL